MINAKEIKKRNEIISVVDEKEIKKRYVSKDINKIMSFMEKQSVYNLAAIYYYDYKTEEMLRICRDGVVTTTYYCSVKNKNLWFYWPRDVIDGINTEKYHIMLSYYLVDRETLTRSRQYRRLKNEETRISPPPPTLEEGGVVLAEDLPEDGDRRISKKKLLSKLKKLLKGKDVVDVVITIKNNEK